MLKHCGARKYREGAAGDGGDGGGAPDIAAQIKAAVIEAKAALVAKNEELIGKNKDLAGKLKELDGVDLAELKAFHEQFKSSEDLKLIKEGKIDEVLARRNEKFIADAERRVKAADDARTALEQRNARLAQRALDDSIRAAATNAGVHKLAVEDALLAARMEFSLDDEGRPVQMKNGEIVLGKNGKDPFGLDEWFSQKIDTKPHWFTSGNSGTPPANGSGNGGGSGKTMRRAAFSALPIGEQAKAARTHRIVD